MTSPVGERVCKERLAVHVFGGEVAQGDRGGGADILVRHHAKSSSFAFAVPEGQIEANGGSGLKGETKAFKRAEIAGGRGNGNCNRCRLVGRCKLKPQMQVAERILSAEKTRRE